MSDAVKDPAPELSPLARELAKCLNRRDAAGCRAAAEQVGGARDATALHLLCRLLEDSSWNSTRGNSGWTWARVAAVNALANVGDERAVHALCNGLFDPSPLVREAAAYVLPAFGKPATSVLIRALRRRTDWSVQSVKLLIQTLGALKSRRATPVLIRVLEGELPLDPSRWARQTFYRPLAILALIFLGWWTLLLFAAPITGQPGWPGYLDAILQLLLNSIVPFLFFYMALVCVLFVPALQLGAARELDEISEATLSALDHIHDKRAIPAVAEVACGPRPRLRAAARRLLTTLLPDLKEEDAADFPLRTERQLGRLLCEDQASLASAVLCALEQVGGGASVEPVAYAVIHAQNGAVRSEASRVYPLLQERAVRERASASLLRCSGGSLEPMDSLLRKPARDPRDPAGEFLRPN